MSLRKANIWLCSDILLYLTLNNNISAMEERTKRKRYEKYQLLKKTSKEECIDVEEEWSNTKCGENREEQRGGEETIGQHENHKKLSWRKSPRWPLFWSIWCQQVYQINSTQTKNCASTSFRPISWMKQTEFSQLHFRLRWKKTFLELIQRFHLSCDVLIQID